jgi:hypothetical protein
VDFDKRKGGGKSKKEERQEILSKKILFKLLN